MPQDGGGSEQLPLDFPLRQALAREDFLVTASNAAAVEAVEAWPAWEKRVLFLVGPAGSGKTHLSSIWKTEARAQSVRADDLAPSAVPALLASGALLVEDAPGTSLDERAMFHLMNLAREQSSSVLVTTRQRPAHWPVTLPDLLSRLRAASVAALEAPDDDLLRGVLVKHFLDRQIAVDEAVVSLLMSRMERSLDAARRIVSEIDRRALAERANVTRSFVARLLAEGDDR